MTLTNYKLEILCRLKIIMGQIISHYENKYIWALDNYHAHTNRTMLCYVVVMTKIHVEALQAYEPWTIVMLH